MTDRRRAAVAPPARRMAVPTAAIAAAAVLAAAAAPAVPAPVAAQAASAERPAARAAFAVQPDTVRIGEPFLLGITVRADTAWRVELPTLLRLGAGWEQRSAADIRELGPGARRAYYRIVAWRTDVEPLAPVEVELAADGAVVTTAFRPPPVTVVSVLPEDEAEPDLRPARPFLERTGLPWPWIALGVLALAALAAWLLRRRRRGAAPPAAPELPADRALHELRELGRRWERGELDGAAFYDGLEETLRRYAGATRGWTPGMLIRRLPNGNRELAAVLRRSALTRFARLETRSAAPPSALEVCQAWLRSEREAGAEPAGER